MNIQAVNMMELSNEEEWCVFCDKDDVCKNCDFTDSTDDEGGWCIFHDNN